MKVYGIKTELDPMLQKVKIWEATVSELKVLRLPGGSSLEPIGKIFLEQELECQIIFEQERHYSTTVFFPWRSSRNSKFQPVLKLPLYPLGTLAGSGMLHLENIFVFSML